MGKPTQHKDRRRSNESGNHHNESSDRQDEHRQRDDHRNSHDNGHHNRHRGSDNQNHGNEHENDHHQQRDSHDHGTGHQQRDSEDRRNSQNAGNSHEHRSSQEHENTHHYRDINNFKRETLPPVTTLHIPLPPYAPLQNIMGQGNRLQEIHPLENNYPGHHHERWFFFRPDGRDLEKDTKVQAVTEATNVCNVQKTVNESKQEQTFTRNTDIINKGQPVAEYSTVQAVTEYPKAQAVVENLTVQAVAEEPKVQVVAKEPKVEVVAEEPKFQAVVEEPKVQAYIQTAVESVETPTLPAATEEPKVQAVTGDLNGQVLQSDWLSQQTKLHNQMENAITQTSMLFPKTRPSSPQGIRRVDDFGRGFKRADMDKPLLWNPRKPSEKDDNLEEYIESEPEPQKKHSAMATRGFLNDVYKEDLQQRPKELETFLRTDIMIPVESVHLNQALPNTQRRSGQVTCPYCGLGRFRKKTTVAGYIAAVLLFPLGTIACLSKKWCIIENCSYCGHVKPKP